MNAAADVVFQFSSVAETSPASIVAGMGIWVGAYEKAWNSIFAGAGFDGVLTTRVSGVLKRGTSLEDEETGEKEEGKEFMLGRHLVAKK